MKKLVLLMVLIFSIVACTQAKTPETSLEGSKDQTMANSDNGKNGYPAPDDSSDNEAYPNTRDPEETPIPAKSDRYVFADQSAFSALLIAEEKANQWKFGAKLLQIPRLRQMESNLSLPTGPSGWFFAFKDPQEGSAVELYLEVVANNVVGTNEVQILYGAEEPAYTLVPIDRSQKLLDNTEVYDIFIKNGGEDYLKGHGEVELDFQLVQLEGMKNAVWSIYDTIDLNAPPLINVDAVSGAIVEDPFAFLRK